MIKLTHQQWIHMVIHATKTPLLFLIGRFSLDPTSLPFLVFVGGLFASEMATDALYWWAINKRPRSGSPDFLAKEPWVDDPLNPEESDYPEGERK